MAINFLLESNENTYIRKQQVHDFELNEEDSDSSDSSNGSDGSDGSGGSGAEESAPSSIVDGKIIDSINLIQEKMENEAMQLDVEDIEEENTLPPKIERLTILDPANWTDLNISSIQKENSTPFFKLFLSSLYD